MHFPKQDGGAFENAPAGRWLARCYRLVDMGTQMRKSQQYGDKKVRQIMISWEITDPECPTMEDGRPFIVSKRFAFSAHEKSTLRKTVGEWRGRALTDAELDPDSDNPFDIAVLLGKPCEINMMQGDNGTYLAAVMAIKKGTKVPPMQASPVYFSLDPKRFDPKALSGLSERIVEQIKSSPEYNELTGASKTNGGGSDDDDSWGVEDDKPASATANTASAKAAPAAATGKVRHNTDPGNTGKPTHYAKSGQPIDDGLDDSIPF